MIDKITKSGNKYEVSVSLLKFKQGDYTIVWCPSLDISSYGLTESSADNHFRAEIDLFFSFHSAKGMLGSKMAGLGWELDQPRIRQPKIEIQGDILSIASLSSRSIDIGAVYA